MKKIYRHKYLNNLLLVIIALWVNGPVMAQNENADLRSLLHQMIENNPDVLKARKSLVEADEQIQIIRTALNPHVDGNASYRRVGPISKFYFEGFGEIPVTPANYYDANISYDQTLYDFGKTARSVAVEEERKKLLDASIDELRQDLSIQLINTYFQIVYLQDALKINEEEMDNLQEHLNTVQKKLDAGTSTKYALLSTQVRISRLKSKHVDLQSTKVKALAVLTSLVGRDFDPGIEFPSELPDMTIMPDVNPALEKAYENRNSLKIAKENETLSELQIEVINAKINPYLSAGAMIGAKNGFEPDLNKFRPDFSVGAGIHVPIYSASENKHQRLLEEAKLSEYQYATESEKRKVTQEVVHSVENMKAAKLKIEQEEMQVKQAGEAYKLAQVSFDSGVITNLDLLDADTNLQDSKLELLKTKIDYLLAGYEVKRASGDKLYE